MCSLPKGHSTDSTTFCLRFSPADTVIYIAIYARLVLNCSSTCMPAVCADTLLLCSYPLELAGRVYAFRDNRLLICIHFAGGTAIL